jgi:hypothetical protein
LVPIRSLLPLTVLVLWGCQSRAPGAASSQSVVNPTVKGQIGPTGRGAAFAIRVPAGGGTPLLYRLPALSPLPNALRGKLPPIERVIGVDPEAAQLFVRTAKQVILAYDLESGRVDSVVADVQLSTLGPDGTLYAVDSKRRVTTLSRRVRLT